MIIYDNELYHYGRPGMKWGQHLYRKDGSLTRKGVRLQRKANTFEIKGAHKALNALKDEKEQINKRVQLANKNFYEFEKTAKDTRKDENKLIELSKKRSEVTMQEDRVRRNISTMKSYIRGLKGYPLNYYDITHINSGMELLASMSDDNKYRQYFKPKG